MAKSKETAKAELNANTEDIKKLILEIAKEEKDPAKIGLILRDKHAIPKAKLAGKKIKQILLENNITPRSESDIVKEKIENLNMHISKNKHDNSAKRSLSKKLWIANRAD